MLRDGFLRFCDNPEIACCKAERELENLRSENASLHAQLTASQCREKAAACEEQTINRGMSVTGEYDIDYNLICPSCGAVVGDAESQELNGPYCSQCGQHLEISPQAEKGEATRDE